MLWIKKDTNAKIAVLNGTVRVKNMKNVQTVIQKT